MLIAVTSALLVNGGLSNLPAACLPALRVSIPLQRQLAEAYGSIQQRDVRCSVLKPHSMACQDWFHTTRKSLLVPRFRRSEIAGLVAGFGSTLAAHEKDRSTG